MPAAGFVLDPTTGRHVAVLGTSPAGADILHAAVVSLARQHPPGGASFVLAPLVAASDTACADAVRAVIDAGHEVQIIGIDEITDTYFRDILRHGPAYGVHLLGWWRTLSRFSDDIGGSAGREDVACLVATNISASDLNTLTGDYQQTWTPSKASPRWNNSTGKPAKPSTSPDTPAMTAATPMRPPD